MSAPPASSDRDSADAERQFLIARIQRLELELAEEREKTAALRAESAELRRALNAWAWQQVPSEEIERWGSDEREEGVPFSELVRAFEQTK
jgi:hypothetical protein